MMDLGSMIVANRVMWMKRFLNPDIASFWKLCIEKTFAPQGGLHLISSSNYDPLTYKRCDEIQLFYKEILIAWKKVSIPCKALIWNNSSVRSQGKCIFWSDFYENGIHHGSDIFNRDLKPKDFQTVQSSLRNQISWIKWFGLISLTL